MPGLIDLAFAEEFANKIHHRAAFMRAGQEGSSAFWRISLSAFRQAENDGFTGLIYIDY